jgi:SAM-dependent methyltransferase
MEWWQELFDETYLDLWAHKLTAERTILETTGIQEILKLPAGALVLDLACGQGRLTVPLAQGGWQMTGLDYSTVLLARAQAAAAEAGVNIAWQRADMRTLPQDWTGRFAAVINIFSAFGYFESNRENQRVLDEVHRVLQPGGHFLIEGNHRDNVLRQFQGRDWFEVGDLTVFTDRDFDPVTGITTEQMHWFDEEGQRQRRHFRLHLYTATDLTRMLLDAGLQPIAYFGGLDGSEFARESRRMVILAQKPAN